MAATNQNDIQKHFETSHQDHLLSYVIYLTKEKFKPNRDETTNFYYGIVTNIATEKTDGYDKRDIFYSKTDGLERINNATTKYQSQRNIYFVHIPVLHSILFSNESYASKGKITPEDLYKFRIEQLGKEVENIEVGNVVKVSFEDTSNFTGGIIEKRIDDKLYTLKLPPHPKSLPKQIYDDITQCKKSPLAASEGQGRALFNSVVSTKEVLSLGLYDFLEYFITPGGLVSQAETANNTSNKYKFQVTEAVQKAISDFQATNANFKNVNIGASQTNNFFVEANKDIAAPNIIRIILDKPNKSLLNYFIVLFNQYAIKSETKNETTLEINFDIESINQKDFLVYSQQRYETLKEFNVAPSVIKLSGEQVSNIKTAEPNPNNTKCDNIVNTEIYIDINDTSKWKRSAQDRTLISYFFEDKKQLPTGKEAFKDLNVLSSLNALTIKNFTAKQKNEIITESNKFYSLGTSEKNSLDNPTGQIGLEKVESNLQLVKNDLQTLKKAIVKNEGLTDQNVLILPISWFEVKPRNTRGQDSDNQHWYGRAADFVVYIKQDGKIFQIPPEVVVLYIEKFLNTMHGIGLFCSDGSYTHYEKLDSLKVSQQKIQEERYWTLENTSNELEKSINSVSPQDFIFVVKEYLQKNYSFNQIGLPAKLGNLL